MLGYAGIFGLVGLIIPLVFTLFWYLLEKYQSLYVPLGSKVLFIQLLLWPSSLFMWATETVGLEGVEYYKAFSLSIAANAVLYAIVGFLMWWGINKQLWVLFILIGLIIFGWYMILTPGRSG